VSLSSDVCTDVLCLIAIDGNAQHSPDHFDVTSPTIADTRDVTEEPPYLQSKLVQRRGKKLNLKIDCAGGLLDVPHDVRLRHLSEVFGDAIVTAISPFTLMQQWDERRASNSAVDRAYSGLDEHCKHLPAHLAGELVCHRLYRFCSIIRALTGKRTCLHMLHCCSRWGSEQRH